MQCRNCKQLFHLNCSEKITTEKLCVGSSEDNISITSDNSYETASSSDSVAGKLDFKSIIAILA